MVILQDLALDPPGCFTGTLNEICPQMNSSAPPPRWSSSGPLHEDRQHPSPNQLDQKPGGSSLLPFYHPASHPSLNPVHLISQITLTTMNNCPPSVLPRSRPPLALQTIAVTVSLHQGRSLSSHSVHGSQSRLPQTQIQPCPFQALSFTTSHLLQNQVQTPYPNRHDPP